MLLDSMRAQLLPSSWSFESVFGSDCHTIVFDPTVFVFRAGRDITERLRAAVRLGRRLVVPRQSLLAARQMLYLFSESGNVNLRDRGRRASALFEQFLEFTRKLDDSSLVEERGSVLSLLSDIMGAGSDSGVMLLTGNQLLAFIWQRYKRDPRAIVCNEDGSHLVSARTDVEMVRGTDRNRAIRWSRREGPLEVYYQDGREVRCLALDEDSYLTERAEALIFSNPQDSGSLIKLFKRELSPADISRMEEISYWSTDDYAFPDHVYYLDDKLVVPCGYSMPRQGGAAALDAEVFLGVYGIPEVHNARQVRLGEILDLLIELLTKVKYIHMNGAIITDYNYGNFRFDMGETPYRRVKLIDVLGYVTNRDAGLYRANFALPEGVSFSRRTMLSCVREDLFFMQIAAFGILSTLLGGPGDAFNDYGRFFFGEGQNVTPAFKAAWGRMSSEVRGYFIRAFDGKTSKVPLFDDGDVLISRLMDWRNSVG